MKYLNYYPCDTANGDGIRCTLFVSGCEMACKGCHNPESWRLNVGCEYTSTFEDKILEDLSNPYIKGLSLSGGHPLHPKNLNTVISLCEKVKQELPDKDIWLWTGYTLAEIQRDTLRKPILDVINVLVDGRFVDQLKVPDLKWRGSSNQCIWRRSGGEWVLHEDS